MNESVILKNSGIGLKGHSGAVAFVSFSLRRVHYQFTAIEFGQFSFSFTKTFNPKK